MRLPCTWCKESFFQGELFELLYSDDGIYFFCSEECSNMWASIVAHKKKECENLQQPSI